MVKHVGKRGDTLIEVMLAVGIFSMVAVAVVAVMSGGTSSSQTALETTVTREEIDSQAEAIRFIHRSYVADKKYGSISPFGQLWQDITALAVQSIDSDEVRSDVLNFHPTSCQEDLYDDGKEVKTRGFIINTKNLATLGVLSQENKFTYNNDYNTAINTILYKGDSGLLQTASTYPHLIYNGTKNDQVLIQETDDMYGSSNSNTNNQLYRAEGIYVVAVADPGTNLTNSNKQTAYYDFYIRTCWYGTGEQTPSTISTVIRLYNPDVTST